MNNHISDLDTQFLVQICIYVCRCRNCVSSQEKCSGAEMKADSAICILLPLDLTILTSSILEKLRTKMLTATEVAASGTKERKTKISAKSYYRIHIYSLRRCCYICTYLSTKISTVDTLRSKKLIPPFTAISTNLKRSLSVYLLLIQSHKRA